MVPVLYHGARGSGCKKHIEIKGARDYYFKTRALLSSEGFMQPAQAMTYENKFWIKLKLTFPWL